MDYLYGYLWTVKCEPLSDKFRQVLIFFSSIVVCAIDVGLFFSKK